MDTLGRFMKEIRDNESDKDVVERKVKDALSKFPVGTKVHIQGTSYFGTIESGNYRRGLYTGERYPLNVDIDLLTGKDTNGVLGCNFEYSLDFIRMVDQDAVGRKSLDYIEGFRAGREGWCKENDSDDIAELWPDQHMLGDFQVGLADAYRIYNSGVA